VNNLYFVITGTAKRQLGILLFKGIRTKYYLFLVMRMSYVGDHHAKASVATTAIENLMHHSTVRETSRLLSSWM